MFDILLILSKGGVAQLVEHATHIRRVRGSNPCAATNFLLLGTFGCRSGKLLLPFTSGKHLLPFFMPVLLQNYTKFL
jgi:hypothetical protein